MADQPDHDNRWHLDRRISIGHLITTMTVVVAVVTWSLRLESRIEMTESRIDQVERVVGDIRVETRGQYTEIIRRLERLDQKIDDRGGR